MDETVPTMRMTPILISIFALFVLFFVATSLGFRTISLIFSTLNSSFRVIKNQIYMEKFEKHKDSQNNQNSYPFKKMKKE